MVPGPHFRMGSSTRTSNVAAGLSGNTRTLGFGFAFVLGLVCDFGLAFVRAFADGFAFALTLTLGLAFRGRAGATRFFVRFLDGGNSGTCGTKWTDSGYIR